MRQGATGENKPARPSGVKWLEGYGTGDLLTIMEAIRDIFRRRGLEVNYTARAVPKTDEPVVH